MMATAYLLASVLTLLVVLVQGQKAIHEQEIQDKTDKLVEVADDIFEDELNSDIDFLLLDSANTRAECNQKKKCKNKGGTCQNKGNACAGKSVKGCSKGCSCCLPEEILCKPSKKCKRANGACISRSECNGKIVAKGCKKPKNCKRTHVCCVQDGSTTEVPTCSGGYRCLTTDTCPGKTFSDDNVCIYANKICSTKAQATNFVKLLDLGTEDILFHPVFGKDAKGNKIEYKPIDDKKLCMIKNPVETWICKQSNVKWTCDTEGFCTIKSKLEDGTIEPDSLECHCPIRYIEDKYIPKKGCTTSKKAFEFITNVLKLKPEETPSYPVFDDKAFDGSMITFKKDYKDKTLCIMTQPVNIWLCKPIDDKWKHEKDLQSCKLQGFCTAKSHLSNGDYVKNSIKCECPNPNFVKKHVCPDCYTGGEALKYTNDNRDPKDTDDNTVLAGWPKFVYQLIEDSDTKRKICKITYPKSVTAWQVSKNEKTTGKKWDKVEAMMECNNLQSARDSGHFFFEKKECIKYKEHPKKKWDKHCETLPKIVGNGTPAFCMKKCTQETQCNAFNSKVGGVCNLMLCAITYPDPTPNTDYSAYYYSFQGNEYKEHVGKIWNINCNTLQSIETNDVPVYCMDKCKQKLGCNAFNYKSGVICILMACDITYPDPSSNPDYSAYYLFPGPLTV